jgi:hypothetical protein
LDDDTRRWIHAADMQGFCQQADQFYERGFQIDVVVRGAPRIRFEDRCAVVAGAKSGRLANSYELLLLWLASACAASALPAAGT